MYEPCKTGDAETVVDEARPVGIAWTVGDRGGVVEPLPAGPPIPAGGQHSCVPVADAYTASL